MRTHLTRYSLYAVLFCTVLALASRANTFTVTTTDDTDDGRPYDPAKPLSLRKAIRLANGTPGRDTIVFDIPAGGGVATIMPFPPLPAITDSVVIDGYTQNGAQANTDPLGDNAVLKVEINGSLTADNGTSVGLYLRASDCEVRGLIVQGFADFMIYIQSGANSNVIAGNWIGLKADGVTPGGRLDNDGVSIGSSGNRIGGTVPADRNVLSGNGAAGRVSDVGEVGLRISGQNASNNLVVGNFIGTDVSGRNPLANQGGGVSIQASGNRLGDGTSGGRNIISGNTSAGISIWSSPDSRSRNNVLTGNYIGLGSDGSVMIPNGSGVEISDAEENTIGGSQPGDANVISGNADYGISVTTWYTFPSGLYVAGMNASDNVIQGNLIGTDATGLQDRGNLTGGILIDSADDGVATGNRVGGVAGNKRLGNVISANKGNGIQLTGAQTTNNFVVGNFIGVDKTGGGPLGNNGVGVWLGYLDSAKGSAAGDVIGGIDPLGLAGNVISGNQLSGVTIDFEPTATAPSGGGHVIQGNYIGTDVTGKVAVTNWGNGILLLGAASDCLIGGTDPGARNVISGNQYAGVALMGSRNQDNRVVGNLIGTDITGANALPNEDGVLLGSSDDVNGAVHNIIGGLTAAERNIISANTAAGIVFLNGSQNDVLGNYVGVDRTGANPLGNGYGIWLMAKTDRTLVQQNHIGSPDRGGGNLICFNGAGGIVIEGTNAMANVIQGNAIGTDFAGSQQLGNLGIGIRIDNAINTVVGTPPTATPSPSDGNWIVFNGGHGVQVTGDLAIGNCIRANLIADNAGVPILLGQARMTPGGQGWEGPPNDAGDVDVGPNELMNYPTLVSTNYDATTDMSSISGWVDTKDPTKVKIDLYTLPADASVTTWLGIGYLATEQPNASGWFCHSLSGPLDPNLNVVATATSPRGSTSGFSPIPTLRLRALEVVQSVQDWSNSIPLIQRKTTYVRAHLETLSGVSTNMSLDDLNPRLHAIDASGHELLGSPKGTLSFGDITIEPDATANREQASRGVLFAIPTGWCDGTVTFWFEGNNVTCHEFDPHESGTPPCKDCGVTVTFGPAPRFELELVDVSYWVSSTNTPLTYFTNSAANLDYMAALFNAMYPVARLDRSDKALSLNRQSRPFTKSPEPAEVNARLDSVFSWFIKRKSLGVIPGAASGGLVGEAADIPSTVASAYYTLPYGLYRATPAHEVGHAIGLEHSTTKATPYSWTNDFGVVQTDPSQIQGHCNEVRDAAVPPPLFPYGRADDTPSLGPMNGGAEAMIYGLDVTGTIGSAGSLPEIINPATVADLMSYCKEPRLDRWVSKYNYERLWIILSYTFGLEGLALRDLSPLQLQAPAQPALVVRGSVNLWAGTAQFTPFSYWPDSLPDRGLEPGEYQLQLLDGAGNVLVSVLFRPTKYDVCDAIHKRGGFIIPLAANPAYRTARILRQGVVLNTRTASAHAPVITSLSPNGGEIINDQSVTISWTAQDADGDPLTYDVQFSGDGGQSWTGLEADLDANQLVVPRHTLPGSTRALVRVIASDGFNTALRVSAGTFILPNLPPRLRLLSPTPNQLFRPNQEVLLRAEANDAQDGYLEDTNLVWQSDRDGSLGSGSLVLRNASSMQAGSHQVTVTASNSAGQSSTASVTIFIRTNAPSTYADLSLTMAVSPAELHPGDNFTLTLQVHNAGRDWATAVHLTNSLPPELTLVSARASQGTCAVQNGLVVASLTDLAPQTDATVELEVVAAQAGLYTDTANVSAPEPDPLPANNTVAQVITVIEPAPALPDLVLAINESPADVTVGGTGDYLIAMVNNGTAPATQVTLTNWLPNGVTLLSVDISSGGQWSANSGQVVARYGSLAVGGQAWLRLHVRIENTDEPLFDKAEAFAAEADAEPLDNTATSILTGNNGPVLTATWADSGIRIEWPSGASLVLEQTDQLGPAAQWVPAEGAPVLDQGRWRLVVQPAVQTRFFRLRQP